MPLSLMQICPVDSSCGYPDQHFSLAGFGLLSFTDSQHFRSAKSRQCNQSHALSIIVRRMFPNPASE